MRKVAVSMVGMNSEVMSAAKGWIVYTVLEFRYVIYRSHGIIPSQYSSDTSIIPAT